MAMKEALTSRERVRLTLNHEEPDTVPIDFGSTAANITDALYFDLLKHYKLGKPLEPVSIGHSSSYYDERILSRFDTDFRHVHFLVPYELRKKTNPGDSFYNNWGVLCRRIGPYVHRETIPLQHATLDDLERFSWPDPKAPGRLDGLHERLKYLYHDTQYAIAATYVDNGPFEIAQQLRGFEEFLIDMVENQEFATALLKKIVEVEKGWTEEFLSIVGDSIDMVEVGDDLGTQGGPMISPRLYRKILKPIHKELFDCIKNKTEAKIWFHTDGAIAPFIPDLIEAGIDILNPVQPVGPEMEAGSLKERFGDQISFHGGIDIQHVLNQDDPDVVEQEIQTKIQALAPGGGYILASTHHLQPDTKPEMIELMFALARKYGAYPLSR